MHYYAQRVFTKPCLAFVLFCNKITSVMYIILNSGKLLLTKGRHYRKYMVYFFSLTEWTFRRIDWTACTSDGLNKWREKQAFP